MIKLVALDLDGTVFGGDLVLRPAVRAALAAVQAQGVGLTLATGRMFPSARYYADLLNIHLPLICYQGAMVRDPVSGAVLFHRPLDRAVALDVIRFLEGAGLHPNLYLDDQLYVSARNPGTDFYVSINKAITLNVVGDVAAYLQQQVHESTKISVVLPTEPETEAWVARLRAAFGPRIYATKSHPNFAEAVNPACDKGAALAALADHLGVAQADTLAIGDGDNDIPMLRWAGTGVAMGQSHPSVQAAADYVTGPLAEDGLIAALERFVLTPVR
jgi:Cof subfamily protein (haloacid dehalogenase superfamily)